MATAEQVLVRVRRVVGTAGNERSTPVVAQWVLRRVLFDGNPVPAWRQQAACAQVSPELFEPEPGPEWAAWVEAAKRVCQGCPVRPDCLADAMGWEATGRRHGILAGLTPAQRDRFARRRWREQQGGAAA